MTDANPLDDTKVPMRQETAVMEYGAGGLAPQNFEDISRACQALSASGLFAVKSKKGNVWVWVPMTWQQCFARVQMGAELGFSMMQSMWNIYDVYGRPHIQVEMAWAKVLSSGEVEDSGEEWGGDGDERFCRFWAKPKGRRQIERTFTIGQARQAQLLKDDSGWDKHEDRMLYQRSKGFVIKDGFAHVMHGLGVADDAEIGFEKARRVDAQVTPRTEGVSPLIAELSAGETRTMDVPTASAEKAEAVVAKPDEPKQVELVAPESSDTAPWDGKGKCPECKTPPFRIKSTGHADGCSLADLTATEAQ